MNQDFEKDKKTIVGHIQYLLKRRKYPPVGVPRGLQRIDPYDSRWEENPQSMLPFFQKIMMSIRYPQRKLMIINGLGDLTKLTDKEEISKGEFCLQNEIFRGVTGYYFYNLPAPYLTTDANLTEKRFFWSIRKGILAYAGMPQSKRNEFNKAVMPNVKKGKVVASQMQQKDNLYDNTI